MDPGENSDSDSDMGVEETSDTPMEVNNTQASSVERTGRGAVQCKKITKMRKGELLNVQYNEDGQRIGEGGKDLASYSGLLAESRISIVDYENWHAVGDEVRDLLWDSIKAKFSLTKTKKEGCCLGYWRHSLLRIVFISCDENTPGYGAIRKPRTAFLALVSFHHQPLQLEA
ncbi:hypothetical protein IFM89_002129 [Coptis chinensis]|uniref:Uncharacterized protein n=1 Tax=Coptis chinensis TaxID=261450 RepID=A0A835LGQ9_9MAGN|nr:hypothetical protein IFM89_002129 [Coptis chinensis]